MQRKWFALGRGSPAPAVQTERYRQDEGWLGLGEGHRSEEPGNAGGAKGPRFKHADRRNRSTGQVSLETSFEIRQFQRKLYTKAKQEPGYRFYVLYDLICRKDTRAHAYELTKATRGAADGPKF